MIFWLDRVFRWIRMTFQAVRNVRNRWVPELKQLSDNIEKLEESLAGTDDCVVDIFSLEEKLEDRMIILEEELNAVKAENIEMRSHFNWMLKQLNGITALVAMVHQSCVKITRVTLGAWTPRRTLDVTTQNAWILG